VEILKSLLATKIAIDGNCKADPGKVDSPGSLRYQRRIVLTFENVYSAERESIPEKSKVLHDYLQCELALQEAKLRLVTVLLDVLQHSTEVSERRENIQLVIDAIHTRAPVHLGSVFISSTYQLKVSALNKQAQLLAQILEQQRRYERDYTSQIHTQNPRDKSLAGFPLNGVSPLAAAHTLSTSSLSFLLFPSPSPPPPSPPDTHERHPDDLFSDEDAILPPSPGLSCLSMKQARVACCNVLQLQCVAACCSVLQRVAACCSVLQRVGECLSLLEYEAGKSCLLQCATIAVCCSVLQRVAACGRMSLLT